MSSSSDFADSGRFSGQRVPEKSNFSLTCSLLSQYIKEKGTFGDLSLGMTCSPEGNGRFSSFSLILPGCLVSELCPRVVWFFLLFFFCFFWAFLRLEFVVLMKS